MLNIFWLHMVLVQGYVRNQFSLPRDQGIKAGLLRPITLFPFPTKIINELANKVKGILSVEMSAGQMVEDVLLAVKGKVPVYHFGRMGGMCTDT